jgi:hypothetical protein
MVPPPPPPVFSSPVSAPSPPKIGSPAPAPGWKNPRMYNPIVYLYDMLRFWKKCLFGIRLLEDPMEFVCKQSDFIIQTKF